MHNICGFVVSYGFQNRNLHQTIEIPAAIDFKHVKIFYKNQFTDSFRYSNLNSQFNSRFDSSKNLLFAGPFLRNPISLIILARLYNI